MSSLEKRHTGQRESMQGHRKYSDGPRDTSSSGSCMDDTDREVSNLTDRAFRSLCIGEEAIYNDSEFSSSPTERQKAFSEETQQKTISHEALSYSIQQYGEAEAQSEMASTFQHSYVDVTHQEKAFREGNLSHMNNGSKEVTWQQSRSTSRVSSLIKAFSSGECYHDSGTCDVIVARDRYRDFGRESWDKSAMLSIQSDLSAGYHQNFKSAPFQSYRNHFYTSDVAATVAQMDTTVLMKSLKSKFKELNSKNSFFHSEFSPFQLWEEYNRFSFQSTHVSGFMPPREFPRWYDSPMYKELKDNHTIPNSPCESRGFNQRQIQNVVASQCSMSTVVQKTSAIEKRCESEMASNYPPWKKNNNLVRNKLPCNRPSTVSPTNERTCRPDSNLFRNNKVTHEIVVESNLPSSVTPFNITQLLTPVIHTRQETETSEILQFTQTPYASDYSSQGEIDPNIQTDVKHLRDSYKFKASSLLFNLKDNRKRVKSTYTPTKFKGIEITDQNKLISKLEGRESQYSDILVSQETAQENRIGNDARASCNLIQEPSAASITPKDYTDGFGSYDNLTLTSTQIQDRVTNYKLFCGTSEGHSPSTDPLSNIEISTRFLSAQDKSSLTSEGQLKDLNNCIPDRTKIANVLPRAYPPTHSLAAQTSERYTSQNDLKQRKDFGRKTFIEHSQNEAVKEKCSWDQTGSVKETSSRSESQPFRGEIAALIEMDKQRKATAKQYFANDSYSVRKEKYMQKVNEDIKLGRLAKKEEKEVRDDTISPRKTSYSEKAIHDNQLSTFSKPIESYRIPKNSLQTKTSPLTDVYGGLQSFSVKNDFVKGVPAQNSSFNTMVTQNTFDQRAHDLNKGQKNEGLYSYQPYRYEHNKQWHMSSTSEDRHTKERVWTQKQSNPALQDKNLVIPNTDTSHQNNISLPTKQENRFSINDILSIRDNEQARRLKDNTFVLAKSENPQNPIKYETAEKLTVTEPVKEQQGYKVQDITSPSPGYVRKDFQNTNETKDSTMSKDTDKVTPRVLSYKERSQSKQEILTSKLKAHAQKEISAIKEKGLAKQGILVRNATKTRGTINNDGQEDHSVKKEITADKLNHLFQDITYSSVTQYKEQIKLHSDHPKNRSPPSTEIPPLHFEDNQNAVSEKDENIKNKPLTIVRQNDKHPVDENEIKETSNQYRKATVANMKNNVHKNYQTSRISEDKQNSMTSSEHINTNKELVKQSHEISPEESMSGHFTSLVKTYRENNTSHNPPAQHNDKQTVQHDRKENLYGSSQSPYTSTEKAVTKPADIIKEEGHVTSTETTKSNSGLNKNALLGLEKNTPKSEEVYVHLKSKITAAVEQSKNEPIKNSSEIAASQLTSSSSDIKFKNGIPPTKQLMEPAKSDLTSNLHTNTLNVDPEQLINRTHKHNSGVSSDSEVSSTENTVQINSGPTNDLASQRTREPETLKPFNNEDVPVLINKNNITQGNYLAKQQNNTSQDKAVERTSVNQMVECHSKPEADEESITQIASAEAKKSCRQKEIHQDDENTKTPFSFDKNELPRNHQGIPSIKDDSEVVNNCQQRENITERASPKQEQGFPRLLEISHEKNNPQKSTKEYQEVNPTNSKPQKSSEDALKANVSPQHKVIVEEDATQINNIQPVLTHNVESTADTSNITILTPSNEEPAEEPIIYSICVSSKTETVSNDEPMIYTICVSSKCPIDEQQNPVKREEESSVETDRFVKDESVCIKNKRAENEHDDVHRQTEVSSNTEEKEDKNEKCDPQTTTDKSDITERISTSYEDLLAKYGLPVRVCSHLTSTHMQDEREQKEKEEIETHLPHKSVDHEMNRPLPSKEKISDTTQTHPEDSRQVSDDQQASITSQPLKGTECEIKQVKVQHYDTISKTHSNNMAEKQQSTGNNTPKLGNSTRDATIILKDTENAEQDQDTHIEPSRQSRRNDIELKEEKVEEQVRNTDKVKSRKMTGNIDVESNSRESPKKTENVSLTAKQPTTTDESTRPLETEVLKAPVSSMVRDTVNTNLTERTILERMIPQSKKKSQMEEGEDKLFNDTDTFTSQKNKIHGTETFSLKVDKTVHEAKQKDPVMAMKQESVSNKHAQTLRENVKEDDKGGEKRSQEKLQVELNTRNEMDLKGGAATHVNNYRDKVCSIGEDVCTVVKQDQACFEVPKIHLEDIKVSTAEVSSNKEFMASHKNQHEVIKKENLKGKKGAVVTELVGEKDFREQKNLPVKTLTDQIEPETVDNMKGHIEMVNKNTYDFGKENSPLQKGNPFKLEKTEINPRRGAVETHEVKVYDNKQPTLNSDKRKKEDPVLSLSGQNDGDLKVNENRSRGNKERNVEVTETKQGEQSNTNQSQPETKGSARYEQEHAQLSQQETRNEGILSKPEATQRNMKVTIPEISAIADYARLKVISAEDDTKELDIFPKTDFYNSYDQPVLRIQKDLYGNVSDVGGESKRDVISMEKCQNLKQKTSQLKKQTDYETLSQNQNHLVPSTVQLKPVSLVASGSQNEAASVGTQPKALTNQKESNAKPTFMEHPTRRERDNIYQSKNPQGVPLQANRTISRPRQMTHDKTTEEGNLSHYGRQESLANLSASGTVKAADNQINMASPPGEEMEELQYYTVNALDTETKPKNAPEPPPPILKMSQNTDSTEKSEEDSFLQSLIDYGKVHATGPQSNSSSPAMEKPVMFRVKDNTIRTSSVTKTVKPCFHRSFSEDFRIGSPKEHLNCSEKEDVIHPIESANPPVNHEPAIAALGLYKLKETLHNNLPSAEYAAKQSKSHQRRSQHFEEEETRSVISTMSGDMENCTVSLTDVANITLAYMPKHESYRDTYQRPASAYYERPESSCYERPESACSDMRPLGRPPVVPPKSEKALRRAQRLTTRRMKKAETPKMAPENQDQLESKSIRNLSGVPSSPSDTPSTHLEVQASPPLSQYDIQPNHIPTAQSIVTQPFPVTQRKLLQDPNSGQYFMVDVPLLVKTKTFYDPETGKYVQLNVRHRSQGALTQPGSLEVLNTPCMLYRGLLPMAASSLTPLRSPSEMSAPADNQDMLERGGEPWSQNGHLQNSNRDSQQYPEQNHNPSLFAENNSNNNERHTDIITMSELEDFAMEST